LVPFGSGSAATSELTFGKESRFVDHRHAHGVAGLVTLIGIRFTTARGDSSAALDLLLQQWQGSAPVLSGQPKPLVGGDIEDFVTFHRRAISNRPEAISARTCEALVCNHGSEYMQVLELARLTGESERLRHSDTLVAEVTHAVRSEMALRLEDVVVRRTDLGSAAHPGHAALEQAARKMQQLCGWSEHRRLDELESAERFLQRHHAVTHPIRQAGMAAVPQ
jgi:glycerol-3-phosphate dehydrogenase